MAQYPTHIPMSPSQHRPRSGTRSFADMVGSNRHASRTGKEARMFVRPIEESAREERGGQTSYLLLGKGDFDSRSLAVTWVECGPNSQQPLHSHPDAEQAYVIVQGR